MGSLTALKVKRAEAGRHGDGDGLYLVVGDNGARKWVLRIQVNGRRRDIGLGSAKAVALADARTAADDMRRAFARGEDPVAARRRKKEALPTFREAAKAVHKERAASWKNEKHAAQWLSSLEAYAFPKLADLPVNRIDSALIRDVLADSWLTVPETARRVLQRVGTVLDYCHAKGWRESDAPMRSVLRGLPKQPKKLAHLEAMPWQDVPAFIAGMPDLLSTSETVLLLLEFTILTAARSGESREARWQEIDREQKTWTIPADRMKAKRLHRVPLSARALEILDRMQELRRSAEPGALIFEGRTPGRPVSDMTLTQPLRRAGLSVTVHGFRSSFRDWAAEATGFPPALAEKALAHTLRNKVEAAYQRGDLFDKRRKLMDAWAAYCASARKAAGNVVAIIG